MNLSSGVSLGQLVLALGVGLTTSGVAWGSLLQRVKTLEAQIKAMSGFAEAIGRIDERTLQMGQDITAMKGSGLFAEPADYVALARPGRRRP